MPDLFFVECTNILWKYVRQHGYPAQNVQQDVADLLRLSLNAVSACEPVGDAMALAVAHEITAYDASYMALPRRQSLPQVTADESLVHRLEGSCLDVRWLGDWPPRLANNDTAGRSTSAPR